jgi:hypothetical protein
VGRQDRLRALIGRLLQVRTQRRLPHFERLVSALPIRLHPHHSRCVRYAQFARHGKSREPLFRHRTHHRLTDLRWPRSSPVSSFTVLVPRFARLAFCLHLSTPSLLYAQQRARQVLSDYAIIPSRNRWFAAQGPTIGLWRIWSPNPIYQIVDTPNRTITNVALPGHAFVGTVHISVEQRGQMSAINVVGTGVPGESAWRGMANNVLGYMLFSVLIHGVQTGCDAQRFLPGTNPSGY